MADIDRDIDRLYQLSLSEFTAARDELAKRPDVDRGVIKRLQKPNIAAWVVNQLYWRERETYGALIRAAEKLRASQAAALKGRPADVAGAEALHQSALKAATDRIRRLLSDAGEAASSQTMNASRDTLQALPSAEPPGRLTRPLKPQGFEALAALLAPGGQTRQADVLPFKGRQTQPAGEIADAQPARRTPAEERREREAARREEQARKREAAKLEARLREAKEAEREATLALTRARQALSKAERQHDDLTERLQASKRDLERRTDEIRTLQKAASAATAARSAIEDDFHR